YLLRFSGAFPTPKGVPDRILYSKLAPFLCAIWFLVFAGSGFYRRSGRHRSAFLEALDIFQSCALATIAFIAFTYVYEEYRYSRAVMIILAALHPWLIIAGRSAIRKALRRYRRRAPPRRTLLIGGGDTFRHALNMATVGDLTRTEVMGAILLGTPEQIATGAEACREHKLAIFENQSDWASFFSAHPTETVVCALPHKAYDFLDTNLEQIADQVPDVRLIPDLVRFTRFAAGVDVVDGTPVVTINESPLAGAGSIVKRLVDVFGAIVAIILFGPEMLVVAALVGLTSRGPILYRQERMGLDGR